MAMPMTKLFRLVLVAMASVGAGCYQPHAVTHATLQISASGEFTFRGHPVARPQLREAIEAARVQGLGLVVEIHASSLAPMAEVEQAVAAVKAAHARVAFASGTP